MREPNARGAGDQLREHLVAAASDLLLSPQSVALPSLRAVARACQVSPAAVYLHFDSQQALIAAVIETQLASLGVAIRAGTPRGATPREQLRAFGLAYAQWALSHPGGYQLLFESADRLAMPKHPVPVNLADDARWNLIEVAAGLLASATELEPREARATAFRVWTVLHGIVSLRIHKADVPWPDLAAEVSEVLDLMVP